MFESEKTEFKRQYIDDVKKEIVAFANTRGGTLYIGIANDGQIVGVEQPDLLIQRIANAVRDSIKPDLTMFVHYETQQMEGKQVVAVEVQIGAHRPYYLSAKGLRPDGVYVRQGTTTAPASDAAIRMMIRETDGDNYEDARALNQSLTFHYADDFFAKRKIEFAAPQMATLGLTDFEGEYTNLGYLLSDQCPHIIKAATFSGRDQQEFQDRREFTGSLLKQLTDAYDYLSLRNQKRASFQGLYREDQMDYPEAALREALLNAIVHRDYSFAASTLISVYSDRIEMISAGGLAHGITMDDVLLGFSVCRNRKLADVFYRLNLIEAYGTGMKKIMAVYQDCPIKPEIIARPNAFKTTLPNQNEVKQEEPVRQRNTTDHNIVRILALVEKKGTITRTDVEEELGVKIAAAIRILKRMTEEKLIVKIGSGPKTRYALPN